MTTLTQTQASAATRGAFPLAGPIAVAAGLAMLAALWVLISVALPRRWPQRTPRGPVHHCTL